MKRIDIQRIKHNESQKKYAKKHKEKYKVYMKEYRRTHKRYFKEYNNNYVDKYRKELNEYYKKYYRKNKAKKIKYNKNYYEKNRIKIKIDTKNYYIKNKEKMDTIRLRYERNKAKTNITFNLIKNLRCRIRNVLNGRTKTDTTIKLVGCSKDFLKQYLESKFKPGMSWQNYGYYGWHIDHIKPCASFDLSKSEEQKRCFHYTNLQPLWAKENLSKGKTI